MGTEETALVLAELRRAGLSPPRSLTVSITRACNLACGHCWVESPAEAAPVSPERLRDVISDFCGLGGRELCVTGGEPLTHPRWAEILRLACAEPRLASVRLQTNGTLLCAEAVAILASLDPARFRVELSLDGATAASHDLVRGEGAYRRAWDGLERLVDAGMAGRTTVAFTEMHHNLGELPEVLARADRLGLAAVTSASVVRCGRAADGDEMQPPSPAQYRELLGRYGADVHFRALADRLGRVTALAWLRGLGRRRSGTCTFIENPYLTPDGALYPCVLLHADSWAGTGVLSEGLLPAVLRAIPRWEEARRVSARRLAELPACSGCSCHAWCGGGCMGRAWAAHGDLFREEDRCTLRRAVAGGEEDGGAGGGDPAPAPPA